MLNWDNRALAVLDALHRAGHQAVLVGGCVRDRLLSRPLHDYDAATSARPEEIQQACRAFRCVDTGSRHGTITVLSDGLPVEVTTFRTESGYSDHRRPDKVSFTHSLQEDLARRDFTINAIAWSPEGLTDPFQGQQDLDRALIRCVGDPDRRFEEDALRVIRGLRLAAQLQFSLDPATARAIHRHSAQLALVAWERISAEFLRLICSPGAPEILLQFPDTVARILPELAPAMGFDQHSVHHCFDVYTHSVKALAQVPPVPALRLAALLHDVGKPEVFTLDAQGNGHFYDHCSHSTALARQAMDRLRLEHRLRDRVLLLIDRHHLPVEANRKWAGTWLSRLGEEPLLQLLALKRADGLACTPHPDQEAELEQAEALVRRLLEEAPCLTLKDLAVNGHDALEAGLSGPEIGRALSILLDRTAQGSLPNERGILLEELRKFSVSAP